MLQGWRGWLTLSSSLRVLLLLFGDICVWKWTEKRNKNDRNGTNKHWTTGFDAPLPLHGIYFQAHHKTETCVTNEYTCGVFVCVWSVAIFISHTVTFLSIACVHLLQRRRLFCGSFNVQATARACSQYALCDKKKQNLFQIKFNISLG